MYREPHPYFCAYVLAGGAISNLAFEIGVSQYKVSRWRRGDPVAEEDLPELFRIACVVVLHRIRTLNDKLVNQPYVANDKKFRNDVDDLDIAYRLCFGQSLVDFFLEEHSKKGGHKNGNA